MQLTTECEREEDGRQLVEVRELPGALIYGQSPEDALARPKALALRVLDDRPERGADSGW